MTNDKDKNISGLPWVAGLHYHIDEPTELYINDAQENMVVSFFNDNKENCCNANYIVKAVNNHQKLVDMVKEFLEGEAKDLPRNYKKAKQLLKEIEEC